MRQASASRPSCRSLEFRPLLRVNVRSFHGSRILSQLRRTSGIRPSAPFVLSAAAKGPHSRKLHRKRSAHFGVPVLLVGGQGKQERRVTGEPVELGDHQTGAGDFARCSALASSGWSELRRPSTSVKRPIGSESRERATRQLPHSIPYSSTGSIQQPFRLIIVCLI
jgi:hypothetical protein